MLVVDAGSFLLPTHVQNMPRLGLNSPTEQVVAVNAQDPGRRIWFGDTSVRKGATHIKLEVSAAGAETYEDVAAGRINTFLCAEESPPSLESEMLFTVDFVCLVDAALRVRARRLTLKQYLEFQHVLVEIRDGQQALVDRALSRLGAKRHVALTLPFFVPAIFAIAQTDLILTVPRRLAKITTVMAGVRVVEAPREIKSFPYFMAWHPRLTNEPAHKWFRGQQRSAVRTV